MYLTAGGALAPRPYDRGPRVPARTTVALAVKDPGEMRELPSPARDDGAHPSRLQF
jgi:hypothetical protein